MMCNSCGKQYARNTKAYLAHTALCGPIVKGGGAQSPSSSNRLEEVLRLCIGRIERLETEVAALKRGQTRRMHPLAWLAQQTEPITTLDRVIAAHIPDEQHLTCLKDFAKAAASWTATVVRNGDTSPLRAFRSIPRVVFSWDGNSWQETPTDAFAGIMRSVTRQFLQALRQWSEENTEIIACNRRNALYFERLRIITSCAASGSDVGERYEAALYRALCEPSPAGVVLAKCA
jgi:hypothetical protein